jgi:hypothetical protein
VEVLAEASKNFKRDGISFLRALLQTNPANRLTAEKALQHPFLASAFNCVAPGKMPPKVEEEVKPETTLDHYMRDAISTFVEAKMAKWKRPSGGQGE